MLEKMETQKVLTDFMVKSMLDKKNKDFFIGKMTLEKVKQIMTRNDSDFVELFWNSFCVAQKKFLGKEE